MQYRVTKVKDEYRVMLIEDVIKADETLITGYGQITGSKVQKRIYETEFLSNLYKTFFRFNTVAGIEKVGSSSYRIEWLEDKVSGAVMHDDVLEFRNHPKITSRLDSLVSVYKYIGKFIRPRVFRRYGELGSKREQFKKCWDIFVDFSKHRAIDKNLSKKEVTEIFKYVKDNERDFESAALIKSKFEHVMYSVITVFMIIVFGKTSHWLFFSGQHFISVLFSGIAILSVISFFDGFNRHHKTSLVIEYLSLLKYGVDQEYLKELDSPKLENKVDFLTLLKRSLHRVSGYTEEEFGEDAFYTLALDYSSCRHRELGGTCKKANTADYILSLLDILIDKYASSKSVGLVKQTPSIDTKYLYEVFNCLGYDRDIFDKDETLKKVRTLIEEISNNVYVGCEIEIIELIKSAVKYISLGISACKEIDTEDFDVEESLEQIYLAYKHKLMQAKRIEEMVEETRTQEKPDKMIYLNTKSTRFLNVK